MKYGIIYKIKNLINGKEYIGQTTNSISYRFSSHCKENRNRHISNSIKTYGKDNFSIEEICSAQSKEDLNFLESFFVNHYNTMYPNGYNHRAGGNQNGICSEELKRKISIAKTGKPNLKRRGEIRSQDQRLKISRSLGGESIIAINIKTNEVRQYSTVHETAKDGHNPSNVVVICKNTGRRKSSLGWKFYYISQYANQSGSIELKSSLHAQRLGLEPAIAE